jgi:hypothetical protein
MWHHYNFDTHWQEFYRHWMTPEIQRIIESHVRDVYGGSLDWKSGDPLWRLSRGNYWTFKTLKLARVEAWRYNLQSIYERRMKDILGVRLTKEASSLGFSATCIPHIQQTYFPMPDTLESIIVIGEPNMLSEAIYIIAHRLFPDSTIWTTWDVDRLVILLPESQTIFDIYSYYLLTRDDQTLMRPEMMLNRIAGFLDTN